MAHNVICYKEGTEQPNKLIIIGAHYDSYADSVHYDFYAHSPGADDNASGTSGVMELARIFSTIDFRKSLMFVAFGGEEQHKDGSEHLAQQLLEDSTDIEFMLNMDMIAYQHDSLPRCDVDGANEIVYRDIFVDAAERLNDLYIYAGTNGVSDDHPFTDRGYSTVAIIESWINPWYHSSWDSSSYLNFEFMEKIVEMAAAAILLIDQSVAPFEWRVVDAGDGQSLRVEWDSCYDDYSYKIVYGINPVFLIDTFFVPPFTCYGDITGLNEGTRYYCAVLCDPEFGYPPVFVEPIFETPMIVPRQPTGFTAGPDTGVIVVQWNPNSELDLSHYKLLRKELEDEWGIWEQIVTEASYVDTDALPGHIYSYKLLAYDNDGYESDSSEIVRSSLATFDNGILFAEETQEMNGYPSESDQFDFYNTALSGYPFTKVKIDSAGDALTRPQIGMYNPLFWVDDDTLFNLLDNSLDTIKWYFGYDTDFFLAGWQTIYSITGQKYFYPGNFYYDELGISYIAQNPLSDFTGAAGINDWPNLELKPDAPGGGRMPAIDIFTTAEGAEVIYTFDSYSPNSPYNGKPVGIAFDTYQGKRVILGFPLYWLTEASAQALITRVMDYFAEESVLYGDVNGDWSINLLDVTYLISYLYMDGPSPIDINNGDPNGDCNVNILDITYLIGYLYKGGPAPVEGCVE